MKRKSRYIQGLEGKTVVITGASSGVGRAAALAFAKQGAVLILAARNGESLNETEALCREHNSVAIAVPTDVTDANEMKQLAQTAFNCNGHIDVWINNAGVLAAGPFDETPIEVHEQVIRTNLLGYINGAHAVLPYFKDQGYGVLINNISIGGWFPTPYAVGYSSSKFGLRGFSEALRGELISYKNIHVCDLFPAFLDTPGMQHAANYTGVHLKPVPPVYDPLRVAGAMVALAKHPKKALTIGSVSFILRASHALFPGLSRVVTSKFMRAYFNYAKPIPATPGNVFKPVPYGHSIHGGWNSQADIERRNEKIKKGMMVAGAIAGLFLLNNMYKKS